VPSLGNGVQSQAVDAAFQPEVQQAENSLTDLGGVEVEVRLVGVEAGQQLARATESADQFDDSKSLKITRVSR